MQFTSFTFNYTMAKVYPAVKAIIQKDKKLLVIKQELNNFTVRDFPGGRIEYGENPYDTLLREVKEEVNLSVKIVRPLGLCWFFRKDNGDQIVCTTFLCKTTDDSIDLTKNPDTEKITAYRWVTPEELLSDEYIF